MLNATASPAMIERGSSPLTGAALDGPHLLACDLLKPSMTVLHVIAA